MKLPDYAAGVLDALEGAGYESWVVGGCVRDALLGRTPKDYDICTAALPEQTEAVFRGCRLVLAGERHGTVGVITAGGMVEVTTFRREAGYADCRHPDSVAFVPELEQDLSRRDFTMNAMAWSPQRGLRDPFGGREDLERRCLRTVGDPALRFREDALRILRGARFCAAYGLTPEGNTLRAMLDERLLLDTLARERVYAELCGFLTAAGLDELLLFAPLLAQVIPELAPTIGFDQRSPHHAYDLYTHIAHVTAGVPSDLTLRWAALLHDIGKIPTFTQDETGRGHFYGHAAAGAEMAREVLHRLHAPAAMTEEVAVLIEQHMLRLTPERKPLRRLVSRLGYAAVRRELALQEADMSSKGVAEPKGGVDAAAVRRMLEQLEAEDAALQIRDLAVDGNDLKALGLEGKQIGRALSAALDAVLDERVENRRDALLEYIRGL